MGPRIRVLVADDHPIMVAGLAATIEAEPDMILVAIAQDGGEAIALFNRHRPDVALIDLEMPGIDGLAAVAAIRRSYPAAKIIAMSTCQDDKDIARSLEVGATTYVIKDVPAEDLTRTIRRVVATG